MSKSARPGPAGADPAATRASAPAWLPCAAISALSVATILLLVFAQ